MAAFVDWGCFSKPFVDPKRVEFLKHQLCDDFGLDIEEVSSRMSLLKTGLRPVSPDEMNIIGPMTHFPNVILNTGYGPWGFHAFAGGKLVETIIEKTDNKMFHPLVIEGIKPKRMYV